MTQEPLFQLGNCYMTPGIDTLVAQRGLSLHDYLYRHQHGDWGDVAPKDAQANKEALRMDARVLSAYVLPPISASETLAPVKVWLITEADRSTTTILLPEEY